MNIAKIIQTGESQTVEFKESFDREALETVIAFSNTKGGLLFIGVSDNGTVRGISVGVESLKNWSNQIYQVTEPTVIPELQTEELNGKQIVIITVQEYPLKPVSFRGKCLRRVSNSNRKMSPLEIAQMHLMSTGNSWDALPARDNDVNALDAEQIKRYIQSSATTGRKRFFSTDKPLKIIEKLELFKNDKPTWAAVLLFGKNPQSPLTQATIHCGRFKGETTIIDDRLISGSIIDQVEEVMDFIRKNTNVEFRITGKPQREEIWDYPLDALREAVINAICHRDYSELSDIQIKIFDETIQIWNPGGLPFELTIDDLLDPAHSSKPRNKLIAQIFYDIALIERYGSGIQRMIHACIAAGLPEPVFEEKFGGFSIEFRKNIYSDNYLMQLGLNERQIKAVLYVKNYEKITLSTFKKLIPEISEKTLYRDIINLVEKKILKSSGQKKGRIYYLK